MWSLRVPSLSNRIIYYHSIHPTTPGSVEPRVFKSHLSWLKAKGFESMLVRDIPAALRQPDKYPSPWVAITFDDGYQDNVEFALPVLTQVGFVATFFVVAGLVGRSAVLNSGKGHMLYEDRPMMTDRDLKRLCSEGMEIGSHTMTHRLITKVFDLGRNEAEQELRLSKELLANITSRSIVSFAYPNGQRGAFSNSTRELVSEIGYSIAATTMWEIPAAGSDLLALPRCEISTRDTFDDFNAKMQGLRDYNRYVCLLLKRANLWNRRNAADSAQKGLAHGAFH